MLFQEILIRFFMHDDALPKKPQLRYTLKIANDFEWSVGHFFFLSSERAVENLVAKIGVQDKALLSFFHVFAGLCRENDKNVIF